MSPHATRPDQRTKSPPAWYSRRAAGAQQPDFEPVALIGAGTCSEVWQVRDRSTGALRALKQLRPEWEDQPVARSLLENEAEVGQRVTSRHVVRVHAVQLRLRPRFIVLEWLAGQTLEDRLASGEPLSCRDAVWIARQCVQGMYDLLEAGFTHGDIKPSNLFVAADGLVKLIDLGFARPDRRGAAEADTESGTVLSGTPDYMAPENLVSGLAHGVEKDIYSLGVTLFRMLTGRLPFSGDTPADVLRQQQRSPAPSIRVAAPHAPRELAELVSRLLSKQPLRRSQGLKGLLRELVHLEILLMGEEIQAAAG